MTSCEPTRCSAYSEDLRWRIVWQTEALRYTSDQVAKELTRMRVALHYCLVQEPCKPLQLEIDCTRSALQHVRMRNVYCACAVHNNGGYRVRALMRN